MNTELLHIKDLSSATIDSACDCIAQFTVGLQRVVRENRAEDVQLIGTGTLVVVDGRHCILTVEHVLAELVRGDRLALLSSFTGAVRQQIFDLSHVQIHRIAKGMDDSKGPDIGLLVLPAANIGNLLAEKLFFNIDIRRERFEGGFLEKDQGFWFTCGVVGESETSLPLRRGFSKIKGYQGLCGVSTMPRGYEDSDFDYFEISVEYEPHNPELPRSFGGVSGGEVWQVPLRKADEGEIKPDEYVLSAVVFYQTAVEDGVRVLRCHGRKTVYNNVPEFLAQAKGS